MSIKPALETPTQAEIVLAIGRLCPHVRLSRNNIGEAIYEGGQRVRYGVFGEVGGSDQIGWTIRTITPEMVGQKVAIFTALEVKRPGPVREDARLKKQLKFIDRVIEAGGIAAIVQSPDEAIAVLR